MRQDDGSRLRVDCRDWIGARIFTDGCYEPEVWNALAGMAQGKEVVWDIGAHIGAFSLRAAGDSRIQRVVAFEPNPDTVDLLRFNVHLNDLSLDIRPVALGSSREIRQLYLPPTANTGLASLLPNQDESRISVPVDCVTVDSLLATTGESAPTLMKIDAEGSEYDILLGARTLLHQHPPKGIVVEIKVDPAGVPIDRKVVGFLESFGYTIHRIPRSNGQLEVMENFLATC